MIKGVLKAIFPRIFLKNAFLVYNQVKAATWDRVFYKKAVIEPEYFRVNESKNPFLELTIDISHFDKSIQDKLTLWTNPQWSQDQYLLNFKKPGFIEPHVGWALTFEKKLIYPSLGFASAPHVHKPSFFETYFKKFKVKKLAKVISLRDTGEENYFHFFNDVLAKLFYLQDSRIDLTEYSIVVSDKLYKRPYFQYYLKSSPLKDLNWCVQQSDEWIFFESAIFCKPYTHTKKYFDLCATIALKGDETVGDRRVFLTRSTSSLRFIENMSELSPILLKYKFEIVDSSQISFEEQVRLFRECRYLVAIHGAGITNIIFREGNPLAILEIIQPTQYIPFHYIMLCKLYKYKYDVMLGYKGNSSGKGGFAVNPVDLEAKIQCMLT
jgi:hypothetical protein